MRKVVVTLVLALRFFALGAQTPVVTTTVNKTRILIGEQLELTLKVTFAPEDYRPQPFEIPPKIDHFTIVSFDKTDTTGKDGQVTFTQKLVLTSFDSGRQTIPAFKLDVKRAGNRPAIVMYSDSVPVEVDFSPADSVMPFHDIKAIIEAPQAADDSWVWWGLIAAAVLVILFFLARWWRRRKPETATALPALPPLEEALAHLQKLKGSRLLDAGDYREYHSGLTNISKRYLARITGKNIANQTTGEVLLVLGAFAPRDRISDWANVFYLNDAVKFARFLPARDRSEHSLDEVEKMIKELDNTVKSGNGL